MKSFAQLLLSSPFFEHFPETDIQALAAHARLESVEAGCPILREDDCADVLYMLVVGKVRLSFDIPGTSVESGVPGSGKVLIRTITEPGRVIGWSAMVEPYHYRATATALEECQLLAFDREWLEAHCEEAPEFGVRLMSQILWVLGNRLRETRIRLVASRYERETLAIRALLDQSASQLSVTSPLHKIPVYLESRLTLADAFQTLELLRVHGDPLEGALPASVSRFWRTSAKNSKFIAGCRISTSTSLMRLRTSAPKKSDADVAPTSSNSTRRRAGSLREKKIFPGNPAIFSS